MKYKYSTIIPSVEELEKKLDVRLPRKGQKINVITRENIHFRMFGSEYMIPKSFQSDGASLPWFMTAFIDPFDERIIFWALVHDYLYKTQFMPRGFADKIFYYGLLLTAGWKIATTFWTGVRIGGFKAWYENGKNLLKFPDAKRDLQKYICKK